MNGGFRGTEIMRSAKNTDLMCAASTCLLQKMPDEIYYLCRTLVVPRNINAAKRSAVATGEHSFIEHTGTATNESSFIVIIDPHILLLQLKIKAMIGFRIEQAEMLFHGAV